VAVSTDGKREIVGLHIGPSEAEIFWLGLTRFRGHPEAFTRGVPDAQDASAVFA